MNCRGFDNNPFVLNAPFLELIAVDKKYLNQSPNFCYPATQYMTDYFKPAA